MLLVFLARMVDDIVDSVVTSAAERGKSLIGLHTPEAPEAPRPRVELVPSKPDANVTWIDGDWNWNGRHWSWEAGHWAEGNEKRRLVSSVRHAATTAMPANDVPASRRPNLMLLAASNR